MARCASFMLFTAFVGAAKTKTIDGADAKSARFMPKVRMDRASCEAHYDRPDEKAELEECVSDALVWEDEERETLHGYSEARKKQASASCITEKKRYFDMAPQYRTNSISKAAYIKMCMSVHMKNVDAVGTAWRFDVDAEIKARIAAHEAERAAEKKKAEEEKAAADEKKAAEEQTAADYDKKWRKIWAQVGLGILLGFVFIVVACVASSGTYGPLTYAPTQVHPPRPHVQAAGEDPRDDLLRLLRHLFLFLPRQGIDGALDACREPEVPPSGASTPTAPAAPTACPIRAASLYYWRLRPGGGREGWQQHGADLLGLAAAKAHGFRARPRHARRARPPAGGRRRRRASRPGPRRGGGARPRPGRPRGARTRRRPPRRRRRPHRAAPGRPSGRARARTAAARRRRPDPRRPRVVGTDRATAAAAARRDLQRREPRARRGDVVVGRDRADVRPRA